MPQNNQREPETKFKKLPTKDRLKKKKKDKLSAHVKSASLIMPYLTIHNSPKKPVFFKKYVTATKKDTARLLLHLRHLLHFRIS